jgi:hypothetical protein
VFRIVRKSRERELTDALLAERERLVFVLAEQVEYQRAQLGMPTRTVTNSLEASVAARNEFNIGTNLPDALMQELTGVMTDEEEELLAMKSAGLINDVQYDAAIERLKAGPDIIE